MPVHELYSSSVYTRIRPVSDGESDGHGSGEAVDKSLAGFEDGAMLIGSKNGEIERFEFPKAIFGPETTQEELFDRVAPELLQGFLAGENDALIFAYGQTGTGKTHTMFGPSESLSSSTPHTDWGVLPRVVEATLAQSTADSSKVTFLAMSGIEFYSFAAWDLNSEERHMCTIATTGEVFGHTFTPVKSTADIAPFIERVYGNRKVTSTKMNAGSSRSHVCIILTLYQVDIETKQFSETRFSIIDLAGSERPTKTGKERVDVGTACLRAKACLKNGKPLDAGSQGSMINYELTELTTSIKIATDIWKAGKRKFKPRTNWSPALKYMLGCCQGTARLGVIVAISQSPQNGWETWFSCTWGQRCAELAAPCSKQTRRKLSKVIKEAAVEERAAAEDLAKAGNSASFQKYLANRKGLVTYTKERREHLSCLLSMLEASVDEDEDDDNAEAESKVLMEIMLLDLRGAFDAFDKNGDGVIDQVELSAILARGSEKGSPNAFSIEAAGKVANDVISYWGEDGTLTIDGFLEWYKEEKRWSQLSAEEKEAWYAENPEHDFRGA